MKEIRCIANAKINLGLDVIRKREDGYHDLKMVMDTIGLHDKIRLKKTANTEVHLKTNVPYLPTDNRNLVVRIIEEMKKVYGIKDGIFVDLYKVIPVGAGLGGGSADAAATIRSMNTLFDLGLSLDTMLEIGLKFGADIPYCIEGGAMLAEGVGERLTPLEKTIILDLVVVKPKVSVSTPYIFKNLRVDAIENHPNIDGLIKGLQSQQRQEVAMNLGNVLEDVTFTGYPQVAEVKKAITLSGAEGALMSGSGSAVFGIYNSAEACQEAARVLKKHPLIKNVFVTKTLG